MKLILDAVTVRCPACQHPHFRPPAEPLPPGSPLTCEECSREVYYLELVTQAAAAAA
jgi:hypothetical protein